MGTRNYTEALIFPENELHPAAQLKFIKKLVETTNNESKILIFTNTPYIVMAIEDYSKQNGIRENCRFYVDFADVSGDTKQIYKTFFNHFESWRTQNMIIK